MTYTHILDIRSTQTLVLTPQLQQAIKLLQFSNVELTQYVQQQAETNPFLQVEDPLPLTFSHSSHMPRTRPRDEDSPYEKQIAASVTLRQSLLQQLAIDITEKNERAVGVFLIDHLDEDGYFRMSLDEVSLHLNVSKSLVEKVLRKLKHFEPTGVFAQNLGECLSLQLAEKGTLDADAKRVLENLEALAQRDLQHILKLCHVSAERFQELFSLFQTLRTRPADHFEMASDSIPAPDLIISYDPEGCLSVELNSATLPKVVVDSAYFHDLMKGRLKKEDISYCQKNLYAANWLIKALHQRCQTILKVANFILERQKDFFLHGVKHLKPLTLKEVAQETGLHESTVSRVTSNKTILTPRGLFSLKYFFTTAIAATSTSNAHSATAVKHQIKTLIESESSTSPLSDDQIVLILQTKGISLARRTVAKYREALRIPSSHQRRQLNPLKALRSQQG